MKIYENASSGNRIVPCVRTGRETDRHDEANRHFWQFLRNGLKDGGVPVHCNCK